MITDTDLTKTKTSCTCLLYFPLLFTHFYKGYKRCIIVFIKILKNIYIDMC